MTLYDELVARGLIAQVTDCLLYTSCRLKQCTNWNHILIQHFTHTVYTVVHLRIADSLRICCICLLYTSRCV